MRAACAGTVGSHYDFRIVARPASNTPRVSAIFFSDFSDSFDGA